MKIYDCFMYFDEDLVLDLRLNILKDYVDKFVIAEATRDHAGNEKKLNFDLKNFSKFKDKIEYLIIDDLPLEVSSFKKNWESAHIRDQHQRNSLHRGFKNSHQDDLIMISDLDEIPNPKKIQEFKKKNKYACFIQKNFHLKLNLLNITVNNWPGTKICVKKFLKSPQWLRDIKTKKQPFWKFYKPRSPQLIMDGGWHFNDLKNAENLRKKILSGAHQEENIPEINNLEIIKTRLRELKDIRGRDYEYKKLELDKNFPEYIINNKKKYQDWIV